MTLNQGTTSSEERKDNEEERETASNDSDSKDDSKDDSRVEIPCSAPSPEQEKDGKDTKVVNEPNTPFCALRTLSERLREYDGPYHAKIQKLTKDPETHAKIQKLKEVKMAAEYEKTHEMVEQFRELSPIVWLSSLRVINTSKCPTDCSVTCGRQYPGITPARSGHATSAFTITE